MVEVERKPMNLIQYMLTPFGLSLRHKSIDYYFTGIVVSVFGLFLLTLVLSFISLTPITGLILRIIVFFYVITSIMAYIHLKSTFWKFIAMYDEISHFEHKYSMSTSFTIPLITFIIWFISSYIACVLNFTLNNVYEELFGPLLSSLFYKQVPITSLWFVYWVFA